MPEANIFELYDVEVEEISLVDHPANRRRFFVVKREGGTAVTEQQNDVKDVKKSVTPGWENPGVWEAFFACALEKAEAVEKQMALFIAGVVKTEEDLRLDVEFSGTFTGKVLSTYGTYPAPGGGYGRPGALKLEGVIDLPQGVKIGEEFTCPVRFTITAPYGKPEVLPTREVKVAGKLVLAEGMALDEGGSAQIFLRDVSEKGYYGYPYPYPAPRAEDLEELKAVLMEAAKAKDVEGLLARLEEIKAQVAGIIESVGKIGQAVNELGTRLGAIEKAVPGSKGLKPDDARQVEKSFWDGVFPRRVK